ncbi:ComEA family DNA-binding protein [Streptomyces fuscichromogenes]|uniref:DNA-binding protein n=1 Tax=Streptomyces fuscichromogenes TaxID=1324013 RepID=A0A917X933_9ACTN|nr:ComEA family DNA-binding protein [Streptomyces fuscichromogenes]GGM93461.1 DNA-binding protein [Streptomyces fuscichromogenes]
MALRSRSHQTHATSGPGRGPTSDGRTRHRRSPVRPRIRHRPAPADELRRRAELLFGERAVARPGPGQGPPIAETVTGTGAATGLTAATTAVRTAGAGVRTAAAALSTAAAVMSSARVLAGEATARRQPTLPGLRSRVGLAVRERMPVWLQTRCGLERRGAVALGVVLVVATALAVQHFWTGRTESVSAPEVVRAQAPYEKSGEGEQAPAAGAGTAAAPGAHNGSGGPGESGGTGRSGAEIVVDVTGKVRDPGVHTLPAGSRVTDALRVAGGVRPGTDTDGLNRARFLTDGEQIVVGGPAPPAAPGQGVGGVVQGAGPTAPVSLNTATVEQLDALPGVGPVLAQHIIDFRTQHAGFRSVDELRQVKGIGDRRYSDLRDLVRP